MPDLGLEVLLKGKNMVRLLGGLGVALKISAVSVLLSLPLGILLGVLMTFKNPILKAILRGYLEFIRIIPQTVRRLIPLSINLITRMIKTTSLVLMIGVVEVLKVAQQIIEANRTASPNAAFGIYLTVFILYFLACWPISLLAGYLEKKWK